MRKSATSTAALSSSGAVRTLRILPVTSICAPRCMWKIIATAMATHSIPIPEAIKMFFDMSDLVHCAARFVPGHTVILMQLRGVTHAGNNTDAPDALRANALVLETSPFHARGNLRYVGHGRPRRDVF